MITIRTGNLFEADAPAIGHGVNCEGVMGAGVAKEFRRRYPRAYEKYRNVCLSEELQPGDAQLYFNFNEKSGRHGGPILVNLATQRNTGKDASLDWVYESLVKAASQLRELGVNQLALPRIGCGIGGLSFGDVVDVLLDVSNEFNFQFDIYSL